MHRSDALLATTGDPAVAALAQSQCGVVSRAQLEEAGLGRGAIQRRVANKRLHRLHRGVYAVGHPGLTGRGRLWAAVLACGGPAAAVLSHRSAAALWDLIPTPARTEVTTLGEARSTSAIRVHRSSTLRPCDIVTQTDGLRLTSVMRTLSDMAADLTQHRLERACHRAAFLRILDTAAIDTAPRPLRAAVASLERGEPQMTRSQLEERFLALVDRYDLPRPLVNKEVLTYEVDFHWPDHRLVVEVDGAGAHLTPAAFESDRRRDAELQVAGWRVVRFTWRQVTHEAESVAATLVALLA